MATGTTTIDIAGLEGNQAAQPRVFAHSANAITLPSSAANAFVYTYPAPPDDTAVVLSRGACIYAGVTADIEVKLESGSVVTFKNTAAGSFLPILALEVKSVSLATGTLNDGEILGLF